jgi:hypothetical protein
VVVAAVPAADIIVNHRVVEAQEVEAPESLVAPAQMEAQTAGALAPQARPALEALERVSAEQQDPAELEGWAAMERELTHPVRRELAIPPVGAVARTT